MKTSDIKPKPTWPSGRGIDERYPPETSGLILEPLLNDVTNEVANAIAVTPFIVVPAHQFEEAIIELDTGALVEDRTRLGVDEIGAHDFIFRVFQHTFQIGFAGALDGGGNLLVAGGTSGFDGQINHRDGWRGDAERHTSQLAFDFGTNQRHGFCSAGGTRYDVNGCASTTLPILLGPSTVFWVAV